MQIKIQKVKNLFHLLKALFWTYRCGWPAKKLYVIGVTGTDGKTTTCTLIYEILKAAGYKTGVLTTVSAKIADEGLDTGLHTTNPDPSLLQPILKKAVEQGITHMVLEVTSHGLDQNRVWGCNFQIGVLTNISHEHLDYHRTIEKYREAKLKLFRKVKYAVLNEDDPAFEYFKSEILNPKFQINSNTRIIKYSKTKLKNISPALQGEYNKYNIAAAEAVAKILGIQDNKIKRIVKSFAGVPGRREEVKAGQDFRVVVDFAHTPNALENILQAMRADRARQVKQYHSPNPPLNLSGGGNFNPKLIVVFGCTGERDKEKRPIMGEIAARLADIVIITSDDTRGESQDEIYKQIEDGISNVEAKKANRTLFKENDRRAAIEMAVGMAKPGDIVLLAGKGHEKSILHGKTEYPWSDTEEAVKAIDRLSE